jgi:hypothetical protein
VFSIKKKQPAESVPKWRAFRAGCAVTLSVFELLPDPLLSQLFFSHLRFFKVALPTDKVESFRRLKQQGLARAMFSLLDPAYRVANQAIVTVESDDLEHASCQCPALLAVLELLSPVRYGVRVANGPEVVYPHGEDHLRTHRNIQFLEFLGSLGYPSRLRDHREDGGQNHAGKNQYVFQNALLV